MKKPFEIPPKAVAAYEHVSWIQFTQALEKNRPSEIKSLIINFGSCGWSNYPRNKIEKRYPMPKSRAIKFPIPESRYSLHRISKKAMSVFYGVIAYYANGEIWS
jgi:hypothetical protein